jgi:glycosyltransferase involved in cell wall biosynthesis
MNTTLPELAATDAARQEPLTGQSRTRRLLYIHPDTMGFELDPARNPLHFLSRFFEGDFLAVWWVDDRAAAPARAEELNRRTRIRFHWTHSYKYPAGLRQLWDVLFYIWKGLSLSLRYGRYDVIVSYGPYRTGIAAYILKKLTSTPLILELPGNPRKTFTFGGGAFRRIKQALGPRLVSFIVKRADHLWLRYPGQLAELGPEDERRVSVFPNFVAIQSLRGRTSGDKYILFLGHPWDLKGVDLLILAWNRLWQRFPDWHLKIVGHCPDRSPYIALQGDNPAIEYRPGTPHPQAMRLMEECSIFVLPSRTDAMARVLIEAMAARKPIVASRVDGTPHYLEHGRTALLFESENVDELAAHLEMLLTDPSQAERVADAAFAHVHSELSEERYAERFRMMVERTLTQDVS